MHVHPTVQQHTDSNIRLTNVNFSFQSEEYTESELRLLCDHMGHSYEAHKRYYPLPDSAVSLAKVSKMLMKSEESKRSK